MGNKCDLEDKKQVTEEQAREFAKQRGMQFLETSAKDNLNVDQAFMQLSTLVRQKVAVNENEEDQQVVAKRRLKATNNLSNKKKKCC